MGSLKATEDLLTAQGMEEEVAKAVKENDSRDKIIVRTSIIGIAANVCLAAFKAMVGILSHSIAVTLDAVNNISDAGSSVITIVGTKLAGREADKKHPFGYGRIEYLSAMIIAIIVLYAGITSLEESVKKIIHPVTPDYGAVALVIIAVGVIVKIVLGRFVKSTGKKVNSDSLVNSGADAMLDSVISASTLLAAVIYLLTKISLEAWLGAIIAVIIIKSGLDMLRSTISEILGERADADLARAIKKTVTSFPDVSGAYDLVLNNYGPDKYNGSIHIEVPDTYSANELDELLRQIQVKVYQENHVVLTAIGVYSMNTKNNKAAEIERNVKRIVLSHEYILQMHGFYYNEENNTIRFDMVVSFNSPDRHVTYEETVADVQKAYPGYKIVAAMDSDYSEM
ncbi:cation diffusion facilitator family transporter [Lachnospiraceae bacterium NK3A20]|nr:cation diffusion facilitator family transporter [Lachnospiraceae bacterium NK3A20]